MKYLKLLTQFIKEILKIIVFIISIIFSGYFILLTIYSTLFIDLKFKEQVITSMSDKELSMILLGVLTLLGILGI